MLTSQPVPTDLTTWQWAFEHPSYSPIGNLSPGAYIDALNPSSRLSFPKVKELATNLSNTLVKTYGVLPGETVSLFASNSIYYPVAMWAALRVGGRVNGASPAYGVDEMVHAIKTAESKIVFTLPACLEVVVEAAKVLGIGRKRIVLLEGSVKGVRSLRELIDEGRGLNEVPVEGIPEGMSNKHVCG
jgi:acyl-CoA synthetase (AMP-forming)/AMP-acid ligase II